MQAIIDQITEDGEYPVDPATGKPVTKKALAAYIKAEQESRHKVRDEVLAKFREDL